MQPTITFRDLLAWKKGHELVISVYSETNNFPNSEQLGLTSQLRRSAVSITSNIAEGFSRKGIREKIQFYYIAHGSLSELENQIEIARDISYISSKSSTSIMELVAEVGKLLNSLIKKTKLRD